MVLIGRHFTAVALVTIAVILTGGFFVLARPQYKPPNQGETIRVPTERPAADAAGAAGWVWAEGTPGWQAGTMLGKHHDFNVAGMQPVELTGAEVAAVHAGLDPEKVRVVVSLRPSKADALAILTAPILEPAPARTCLLALLPGDAPLSWQCPGTTTSTGSPRVLVAAAVYGWPNDRRVLDFVGIARGDVQRVVLRSPGFDPIELYTRGTNWGQFSFSLELKQPRARLFVYDKSGLVQKLPLELAPGEQRVFS